MLDQTNANIERHIKTHTERSDDDRAAVSVLKTFLRSNGRINPSFASDDKWPNHDGTFEFVPDPDISRRPQQTFYVQIKGTRNYTEREGVIKYTLKDLAFPAFICGRVSLDPGILFVILNPAERGNERVFWKYMSPSFLNSIDFAKDSTALQNLQRRINNPGADASFVSINSFTKRVNLPDYDVIFVDECSTIDNRAMKVFLEKMRPDTFLVLAGDTYQIESIDFGNWFTYAKDIIKTKGSNVELVSTWRTKDPGLIELWNETRNKGALITEKLVIDGPFSENIGAGVLNSEIMDEVILCLNYDGKFGLNNMNSYFQNANTETAVVWRDWKYKVGDHILFNDTDRFSLLYNNLKGRIVQIELFDSRIRFTVDVEIPLTEQDCQNDGIEFIDIIDDVTRIRFDVLDFEEEMADGDRKKAIVPFQLAYAVSIHKAQGLEYRSVKVVIPSSNAEKITHGIFYTAITRAKEKLKIYWSSETMQEVVAGFSVDTSRQKSLAIIKEKLKQDKNT